MPKKKGARVLFGLVCLVCKSQNYVSQKNRLTTTESISLKKYCRVCRKHTTHKEKNKLN